MKRKFFSLFTVLLVGMGLVGGTEYEDTVHDIISYFDDELLGKFIEKDANFCYSPVSIYGLLYAVQKGTQGETQNQINKVLGVQPSQYLDKRIQKTISKIPNMSNSIWYQDSLTITDEYKEFLKNIKFDENKVDFKKPEQAKENINRYIFKKTNGLLNNSIQGELPADTKLILLNTLYFNQKWRFKFEEKKTYNEPFYKNAQDKKNVPMMHKQYNIMSYYENDDVQMAELEYQNKRYSMIIILPKTIEYDLKKLTPGALIDTFNYYKKDEQVKFTLPKFEMNADYNLVPLLQSLGVKDIFDMEGSNFFKIFTSAENLYINVMNHQTYIKIDEEETKAAARTLEISKAASIDNFLNIPKIYIFKADHPFVYVIRDNELNINLFTGCVREM